jgi:hypothetical protein
MATYVDLNPYPLGAIQPTSGSPLNVLNNFPNLVWTMSKVLTVTGLSTNSGNVYVGRSTMNRSTLAGVLLIVAPGQTLQVPFNMTNSNILDLTKFYVDVDHTGDQALIDALFA